MARHQLPQHGKCYVCGTQNPQGMGVTWFADEEGVVSAEVTLTEGQQGPPGLAHGGASAALLDEAMGAAVWLAGHQVAAVNLNVDFRKPLPLGQKVTISGWVAGRTENSIRTAGEIKRADGEVAVAGSGVYVEARHLFTRVYFEEKGGGE